MSALDFSYSFLMPHQKEAQQTSSRLYQVGKKGSFLFRGQSDRPELNPLAKRNSKARNVC